MPKEVILKNKEIRLESSGQAIAEIINETIQRYKLGLRQLFTGEVPTTLSQERTDESIPVMTSNIRVRNQEAALRIVIGVQQELLSITTPYIKTFCYDDWELKYKTDDERKAHPFEDEENHYTELKKYYEFLTHCRMAIIKADETPSFEDDFVHVRDRLIYDNGSGEKYCVLTENFFEMSDDLKECYESIFVIILRRGLVNQTIEQQKRKLKANEIY